MVACPEMSAARFSTRVPSTVTRPANIIRWACSRLPTNRRLTRASSSRCLGTLGGEDIDSRTTLPAGAWGRGMGREKGVAEFSRCLLPRRNRLPGAFFPSLSCTMISTFRSASSSILRQVLESLIPSSNIFRESLSGRSPFSSSATIVSSLAKASSNFMAAILLRSGSGESGSPLLQEIRILRRVSGHAENRIIRGAAKTSRLPIFDKTGQLPISQSSPNSVADLNRPSLLHNPAPGTRLDYAVPAGQNRKRAQGIKGAGQGPQSMPLLRHHPRHGPGKSSKKLGHHQASPLPRLPGSYSFQTVDQRGPSRSSLGKQSPDASPKTETEFIDPLHLASEDLRRNGKPVQGPCNPISVNPQRAAHGQGQSRVLFLYAFHQVDQHRSHGFRRSRRR